MGNANDTLFCLPSCLVFVQMRCMYSVRSVFSDLQADLDTLCKGARLLCSNWFLYCKGNKFTVLFFSKDTLSLKHDHCSADDLGSVEAALEQEIEAFTVAGNAQIAFRREDIDRQTRNVQSILAKHPTPLPTAFLHPNKQDQLEDDAAEEVITCMEGQGAASVM